MAQLVGAEHAGTLTYVRGAVAQTRQPIISYFAQVTDDPSVQLAAQAQLDYARRALQGTEFERLPLLSAAAPFKAGGRQGWNYYTDIPAGPVAVRNIADLYIYPNTVKAVRVTGATVREWLEICCSLKVSVASTPLDRPSSPSSTKPSAPTTSTPSTA